MKKTSIILVILGFLLQFCKEENPIKPDIEMNTFTGKVYSLVKSEKVFMSDVTISINSDTTISDSSGSFMFADIPMGKHQIIFNFDSCKSFPYLLTKIDEILISKLDSNYEFFIHEQGIVEGKIFTIIGDDKNYLENVEVTFYFSNDTAHSDAEGKFNLKYDYSMRKNTKNYINFAFTDEFISNSEEILLDENYLFKEFFISPKVSFNLELYKMVGVEKINVLDASPRLNGQLYSYKSNGVYTWVDLEIGDHKLDLEYPQSYSIHESINLNNIEKNVSYEIKQLVSEDIIYVADQNFYLRNSKGETFQITYTNEQISNEVKFFKDRNRFVYVSVIGENHFSINSISLNPLYHRVIYEAEVGIKQPRISPDENKIFFMENTTTDYFGRNYWNVKSVDLNSREIEIMEKEFFEPLLFHDCNRIAYTDRLSNFDFRYTYIYNIQNEDSLLINETHNEQGGGHKEISNNDRFILFNYSYDAIPLTYIFDITLSSVPSFSATRIDDGYDMNKFTENNLKYYGILSNVYEERPYQSVMFDVNTGEKTVIGEGFDKFTMLSYSTISNMYMFSAEKDGNGDIQIYDANNGRTYDFISTSANEYNGIFVNR